MRRDRVEAELLDAHAEDGAVFPAYDDYCFANVPDTVAAVLGAAADRPLPGDVFEGVPTDVDNVVVVLVDGFGWEHWKRDQGDHRFLADLAAAGTVTPLTTIYPSETAAAITTMHTGRQPVEHGVLGWYQYYPDLDAVLRPLPFTTLDGTLAEEAFGDRADPDLLVDADSIYQRLAADGVAPTVVQPAETVGGAYTNQVTTGATVTPYADVAEMAVLVRETLAAGSGPSYVYAYVPNVDTAAHRNGTGSAAYRAQLSAVTESLRRELAALDDETAANTLLVVTADHGHVDTRDSVDLREHDDLWTHLRRDGDGDPIPPLGSSRNAQFLVRDGHVDVLDASLHDAFDLRTFDRDAVRNRSLFGDRAPSARFEAHLPDLVAVHRDRGLCFTDRSLGHVGRHGGLTREEMLVPFAAATLADLA
ncbi:alkaline phosphatase family protein [Halobacteriaceae archaeon GCM10025711]